MEAQTILIDKDIDKKKREIIDNLIEFFASDIPNVIKYINDPDDPIPVEHITPSKRIDLHPTREYLLRIPRIMKEIEELEQKMDGEDDEINLYD